MNYSPLKTLADIREEIWGIQEQIEQEKGPGNPLGKIYKSLGLLSNKIMRYMHLDLENSKSIEELIEKLKTIETQVPLFSLVLINVKALKNNKELVKVSNEKTHDKRMKEIIEDLFKKINQR